jgi:hypothetical protein
MTTDYLMSGDYAASGMIIAPLTAHLIFRRIRRY